jgi:Mg-chelatase subunit ChlD
VSRGRTTRIVVVALLAALAVPGAAGAALSLRRVDLSGYPTVRATVVAPVAADSAPTLTQNGHRVVGLRAVNLASTKSVVVVIDRSRSMAGKKRKDAEAAARAFVFAKSPSDRIAVVVIGSRAVQLTKFSSSTIDADDALRTLTLDPKEGTALNDGLQLSAQMLAAEPGRARVACC